MARRVLPLLVALVLLAMSPITQGVLIEHPHTPHEYWGLAYTGSSDDSAQAGLAWVCAEVDWNARYTLTMEEGSPTDELLLRIPVLYRDGQLHHVNATATLGKPAVIELGTSGCGHDFLVDGLRVETIATYHLTIQDIGSADG